MSCLIFGGTRGIGAAIARLFFENNYKVAVASSQPENVSRFLDQAPQIHSTGFFHENLIGGVCNVTQVKEVRDFIADVQQKFEKIDILVNAAGISRDGLLLKVKDADINEQINVNLLGTINTCRAIIKPMMQQRSGCIINLGSVIGRNGNQGQTIYSATKAGLEGFTKSLAKEVGSRGIRANVIAPGFIKTDMTKDIGKQERIISQILLGRFGEPEEVAQLAYFLTTAHYITGQVLCVDGGLQM